MIGPWPKHGLQHLRTAADASADGIVVPDPAASEADAFPTLILREPAFVIPDRPGATLAGMKAASRRAPTFGYSAASATGSGAS